MADKITIGLDDQTDAGAASVEANLDKIESAAGGVQHEFDEVGQAAADAYDAMRAELDGLEQQVQELEDELADTATAAVKVGTDSTKAADKGKSSFSAMSLKIIGLNQALELSKKIIGAVSQTVNSLADSGSPAFVRLRTEVDSTYQSLLKLADEPAIQSWVDDVSAKISGDLIPTINGIPNAMRETAVGANILLVQIQENLGLIRKGASETYGDLMVFAGKATEAAKDQIAAQRSEIAITKKLAELRTKIAAESELKNLAAIEDSITIKALIEDETDALAEREKAGDADAKSREAGLRKIELLERRLAELPAIRAQKEIKAQEEASAARHANVEAFNANMKAMAEQNAEAAKAIVDAAIEKAKQASDELLKLIENAKGDGGKGQLEQARQSISPQQVRDQLVRQKQEEARQRVLDEQRASGRADQNGQGIGNTAADRQAATRRIQREQEMAARQAGVGAFRDFNAGKTSQADVTGAQTALIQSATQQAQSTGQLGQGIAQALMQATNNQQQLAQQQAQQAEQIRQVTQALQGVGSSVQNTRARAQSGGFRK